MNELLYDAIKSAFQGSLDHHDRKRDSDVRAKKTDNICSLFMCWYSCFIRILF